jgi:hypothetical protein
MADDFLIPEAREIAKRYDGQAAVVLLVARDGTVTVASYGETRHKCRVIGEWAQGLWNSVVSRVPFQTVFGWGNGGRPLPLTPEELATLSPKARTYVARQQEGA